MVKLFFIGVFKKIKLVKDGRQVDEDDATLIQHAADLSTFGYFQRSSAGEFLKFTSKMVAARIETNKRTMIKEKEYMCHVYARPDNTAVVIVADEDYPTRAAHSIINKILEEFPQCNLEVYLRKFQDPKEADTLMRLQAELDETRIILHDTIGNLLKRGEKLDDLVQKSEDLSSQSKLFFKTARKTTRCCEIF